MNWLTASDADISRAEKRLVEIRDRFLKIRGLRGYRREEGNLKAERAELMFGDKSLGMVLRKRRRRR